MTFIISTHLVPVHGLERDDLEPPVLVLPNGHVVAVSPEGGRVVVHVGHMDLNLEYSSLLVKVIPFF